MPTDVFDPELWHKCFVWFPRRTIDGGWTTGLGQIWRRKINGRWEYQQDDPTQEEWMSSQW